MLGAFERSSEYPDCFAMAASMGGCGYGVECVEEWVCRVYVYICVCGFVECVSVFERER